jgi:hypothetical protein
MHANRTSSGLSAGEEPAQLQEFWRYHYAKIKNDDDWVKEVAIRMPRSCPEKRQSGPCDIRLVSKYEEMLAKKQANDDGEKEKENEGEHL